MIALINSVKRKDWTARKEEKPSTNSLILPLKILTQEARSGEPLAATLVKTS